ncbi:MAG: ATP-dependent sacrificial sulfur transferase LarE [bacterium]
MIQELETKYNSLKAILSGMGSVVVGFSGGIDSTLLIRIATETLGDRALAVIGRSETYPTREFEEAVPLAKSFGSRFQIVNTEEIDDLKFKENPPDRCYFCKTELFGKLTSIATTEKIPWIADGTIMDDLEDFRPGMRAKAEQGIRSPLLEAGFSKNDVRALARELGIPNWDKQSFACLASRFPYGHGITKENLNKIDGAETFLRDNGFRSFRVRHHDDRTARIELGKEDFNRIFDEAFRTQLLNHFKQLGFIYVTLDLQGYRTGSMNEVLSDEIKSIENPSNDAPREAAQREKDL